MAEEDRDRPVDAGNTLYVRNLSPHVSEGTIREVFKECDEIVKIKFRAYPGSNSQFFAQIEFRTPRGVIEGNKLSGVVILGTPCGCSVVDPVISGCLRKEDEAGPADLDPRELQKELLKRQIAEKEEKRIRTVHVAGLAEGTTDETLRAICANFGEVKDLRVDQDGQGNTFGLVEFGTAGSAHVCKTQQQFLVEGKVLIFTESRSLVDEGKLLEEAVQFQSPLVDAVNVGAVIGTNGMLKTKLDQVKAAALELVGDPSKVALAWEHDKLLKEKEEEAGKKEKKAKKDKKSKKEKKKKKKKKAKKQKKKAGQAQESDSDDLDSEKPAEEVELSEESDGPIDLDEVELVGNTEKVVLGGNSSSSSSDDSSVPDFLGQEINLDRPVALVDVDDGPKKKVRGPGRGSRSRSHGQGPDPKRRRRGRAKEDNSLPGPILMSGGLLLS